MNRFARAAVAATSAAGLMLAAACGGTVADPGAEQTSANKSAAISVQTAKGTVKLDKPATRVVSLEWSYHEELMALGVTPVGAAGLKSYDQWVTAPGAQLPESVTNVGTRQEPSIEKIKSLNPDLIVSDVGRLSANYDQLSEIAPVIAFKPTKKPRLETMKQNFQKLAKAVGKKQKADQVLANLESKVDNLQSSLEKAGKAGSTFALSQGYTSAGAPGIRMFTSSSMAGALLEQAGLKNGWHGKPDDWGMTTAGVEALTKIDSDATFLYVALKQDDPFTGVLADNPVWQQLPFVEMDRVRALDPGTWLFGGPLSAMQLLDETATAFGV